MPPGGRMNGTTITMDGAGLHQHLRERGVYRNAQKAVAAKKKNARGSHTAQPGQL